jgi:hypothetical protein
LSVGISVCAFGQLTDPNIKVGSAGVDCKVAGCNGDPNLIDTTGFALLSNGAPTADIPWYILVSIPGTGTPDASDPTPPTITGTGFTISAGVDAGDFLQTTSGDIYAFASAADGGLQGDNSMNATNMFGTAEQTAFGSKPDFFDVFVYTVSAGSLTGNTTFQFSSTLTAGTFIAGLGCAANGQNATCPSTNPGQQFSTPFTTTGLVSSTTSATSASSTTSATSASSTTSTVPEPASFILFGGLLIGAWTSKMRKKLMRS